MSWAQLEGQLAHLPDYLSSHVLLTLGALAIGIESSLPLALLALRHRRLAGPLLGAASVIQTIPGLALLALMVPLLGRIGVVPALVALILYSRLPILRNTVTGALATGEIDVYVDYTGTIWANPMKRDDTPGAEEMLAEMTRWLEAERGLRVLGALGFENAYALAMRRDRATALGIETLGDLAPRSRGLSIGGDYELFARPEWMAVRDRYGLDFREQRSFDSSLMYRAVADGHVDAISAFSTDGRIAAYDLIVLDDTLQAFPPYDAVVLLSGAAAERADFVRALRPLVGAIDDEAMRNANRLVDLDGRSLEEAASTLARSLPD